MIALCVVLSLSCITCMSNSILALLEATDGQQPEAVNKKAITIINRVREKLTGTRLLL